MRRLPQAGRRDVGRQLPRPCPRRPERHGPSPAGGAKPSGEKPKAPPPPPADTLPPGLADHPDYEIKRELGRGGMGVVYLAHNRLMGRDEVLKVMGREIIERPGALDRFLREIRAVARLRHPNIVTAFSAVRIGESIVFAMEYVDGLDLSRMVKTKGPLPVAHACNFVHQAALGLQHAHEEGFVHRDIKPGNLMLSRKGDKALVKVLDFGLAKLTSEGQIDSGLTREGQMLGTPDYIAPEQIRDAQSADVRADIYSLGGTLYYLLTGRPPFRAKSLYDMYQAHISRDADPLNLVRPEVPAELAALVAKMMAKEPERRFQAPAGVAQALTPFFKKGSMAFKGPRTDVSQAGPTNAVPPGPGTAPAPTEPTTAVGGTDVRPKPAAPPAVVEPRWESLIEIRDEERPMESAPATDPGPRPPWRKWPIALAGSLFGLLALGVIITIRDKDGHETRISVPDGSSVVVEGPRENIRLDSSEGVRGDAAESGVQPVVKSSVATADPPATPGAGQAGWVSLFNGKDLTGWKTHLTQPGNWRVENGVLVGSGLQPSHLYSERGDYRDFHLRIEARINDGGNSGVYFRAPFGPIRPPKHPNWPNGYEAQINSTHWNQDRTGSLRGGRIISRSSSLVNPQPLPSSGSTST